MHVSFAVRILLSIIYDVLLLLYYLQRISVFQTNTYKFYKERSYNCLFGLISKYEASALIARSSLLSKNVFFTSCSGWESEDTFFLKNFRNSNACKKFKKKNFFLYKYTVVLKIEIFPLKRAFKTRCTIFLFITEELDETLKFVELLSSNADTQRSIKW